MLDLIVSFQFVACSFLGAATLILVKEAADGDTSQSILVVDVTSAEVLSSTVVELKNASLLPIRRVSGSSFSLVVLVSRRFFPIQIFSFGGGNREVKFVTVAADGALCLISSKGTSHPRHTDWR